MSSGQPASPAKSPGKRKRSDRVCLLVLGMHRSGTSALTRVLSLLGADLPATLMDGSDANLASNAKGHWESEPLARLNDEIFKSAGIHWRSPEAMPSQWYESVRFTEFQDQARALIESEFGRSRLFVFKDPRLCKLVPFWISVLEDSAVRPAIISMVRSPQEVADSLLKRNALDRPLGMLMWLRYVLGAERDTRDEMRVHLSYDGLLDDWHAGVQGISSKFDIPWPADSVDRNRQISEFLSKSERHHERAPDPSAHEDVSSWADEAYAIFEQWAADQERKSDYQRLDAIAQQFEQAVRPLLAPLLVSYEKSTAVQKLQTLRSAQNAEIDDLKRQIGEVHDRIADLATEIELPLIAREAAAGAHTDEAAAADLGNFAAALKAQREASSHELLELREQATEFHARVSSLQQHLDLAAEELARKESEHSEANARLADVTGRLKSEMVELSAGYERDKQAAASREARLHELLNVERKQRLKVEANLAQAQKINAALLIARGRYEAASEELARVRVEGEQTRKRLQELQKEYEDSRAQLKEAQKRSKADREKLSSEREKMQSALIAVRDDRALRLGQRDSLIKELKRSVKRLERELEKHRERENEVQAAADGSAPAAAAPKRSIRNLLPGAERRRLRRSIDVIKSSGLFDAGYYQEHNADLEGEPDKLLEHFVVYGGIEGRAPSAAFDSRRYLKRYPDVAAAGLNPLLHYLECGRGEGRTAIAAEGDRPVGADEGGEIAAPELRDETQDVENGIDATAEPDFDRPGETESEPASLEIALLAPEPESFSSLANGAADWLKSAELPQDASLTIGGVKIAVENASAPPVSKAALLWFEALRRGQNADIGSEARDAVRSALDDDRFIIEDAWLSTDFSIRMRISGCWGDALVVRCCQQSDEGTVALCSEQLLPGGRSVVVDTRLASRFSPILLVLTDEAGQLIDSTLLPFPSLLRGGLNHGELINTSNALTGWAAHAAYAAQLLDALTDNSRTFAVREVLVELRGANGTEAVFSEAYRRWIRRRFNVAFGLQVSDGDDAAAALLGERLQAGGPQADCRKRGHTLTVAAGSIPTLRILLADESELAGATRIRTIVADEVTRRPLLAVDYPVAASSSEVALPMQFDPPLARGRTESTGVAVASISFSSGGVDDVRAAFPVAGDSAVADIVDGNDTPISAIIQCSGSAEPLVRLLASLTRQQTVSRLECLLIGTVPDVPDSALLPFGHDGRMTLVRIPAEGRPTGSALRAAMEQVTYDHVLLVDDKKAFHDPRTLGILDSLCSLDETGTAGCQLVTQRTSKSSLAEYTACTGYLPLTNDRNPTVVTRADPGRLALPEVYAVLANPIDCLMTKREAWSLVGDTLDEVELNGDRSAILAGAAIVQNGKLNITTSAVSVYDMREPSSVEVALPLLPTTPQRFTAVEEY